jgi:hypothetical protein
MKIYSITITESQRSHLLLALTDHWDELTENWGDIITKDELDDELNVVTELMKSVFYAVGEEKK